MDKKYFVRKVDEMKRITQTAGRNALKEFSLEFAHFNDDILFGENWNNQDIDLKTRSIITVVALMSSGITDSSLIYHLQNAKEHGVTQRKSQRLLLMWHSIRAGQRAGQFLIWQRKYGSRRKEIFHMKMKV